MKELTTIQARLLALQDEAYRAFHKSLVPTLQQELIGVRVPQVRKLAKELHVSVITTQRAYDDLQKDGFIVTVPAKGTFVSAQNQDFIREENRRRVELLLTDAVELAKENGIELEELRTTLDVLYQEEDV